jgi:hypothetical protein
MFLAPRLPVYTIMQRDEMYPMREYAVFVVYPNLANLIDSRCHVQRPRFEL